MSLFGKAQSVVYRGTVTGLRISAVDGTAFVDNLPAGILALPLNGTNQIEIYDGAGMMIRGVLKAVGTGETLGSELVNVWTNHAVNPFETFTPGTGTDITSGINSADTYGIAGKNVAIPLGQLIRMAVTINTISGGWNNYGFGISNHPDNAPSLFRLISTNAGTYQTMIVVGVGGGPSIQAFTYGALDFSSSGFSCTQVLTPSISGATIVSAKAGAVYNFGYKDANFTYNAAQYVCLIRKLR